MLLTIENSLALQASEGQQRLARAWLRMRSIRSGPEIPSGKPGKFSTSVVVISCPPLTPPACTEPSLVMPAMLCMARMVQGKVPQILAPSLTTGMSLPVSYKRRHRLTELKSR